MTIPSCIILTMLSSNTNLLRQGIREGVSVSMRISAGGACALCECPTVAQPGTRPPLLFSTCASSWIQSRCYIDFGFFQLYTFGLCLALFFTYFVIENCQSAVIYSVFAVFTKILRFFFFFGTFSGPPS